jgi:hypothetical protein
MRVRLATVAGLFAMLWRHGFAWLLPAVVVLVALAFLFVLAQTFDFAAPFLYAIF